MIQGEGEPLLKELVRMVGAPAATATLWILIYHKFIAPKNGGETKEILHHLDMALTKGFDQLRRDLEVKVETTTEDRLTAYLFRRELERGGKKGR